MSRSLRKLKYVLGHTKKHHKQRFNKRDRQLNRMRILKGKEPMPRNEIGRVEKEFFLIPEWEPDKQARFVRK